MAQQVLLLWLQLIQATGSFPCRWVSTPATKGTSHHVSSMWSTPHLGPLGCTPITPPSQTSVHPPSSPAPHHMHCTTSRSFVRCHGADGGGAHTDRAPVRWSLQVSPSADGRCTFFAASAAKNGEQEWCGNQALMEQLQARGCLLLARCSL
jgi:hypothetical protein